MTNLAISMHIYLTSTLPAAVARMREERGQDLIEYAMLAGFIGIALAIAFILTPLNQWIANFASAVEGCLSFGQSGDCALPGIGGEGGLEGVE